MTETIRYSYFHDPNFDRCKRYESSGLSANFENLFGFDDDSIIHFGWIISMAKFLGKNFIVVCSDFVFSKLRGNDDSLLVYKVCETIEFSNSLIIGVAGLGIFHSLNSDPENQHIWSSAEILNPLTEDTITELNIPVTRRTNFEASIEDLDTNLNNVEVGDEDIENQSLGDVVSVRIGDVSESESDDDEPSVISLETACSEITSMTGNSFLMSSSRIDFDVASENIRNSLDNQIDQTFDIDGIFIAISHEDIKVNLKCPLTLLKSPRICDKRNLKNFVKIYTNTSIIVPSCLALFKIGFLAVDFGKFEVYLYHGLQPSSETEISRRAISSINRSQLIKECVDFAREFPCEQCPEHGPLCSSQLYRSQRASHLPISGVNEDLLSVPLLPCFFHHVEVKLNRILNIEGLESGYYLRSIGTKNCLVSDRAEDFYLNVERIYSAIDIKTLPLDSIAYDFCIQSVKRGEAVNLSFLLLL